MYDELDNFLIKRDLCKDAALKLASSMLRETKVGTVTGSELIKMLKTVPFIGDIGALAWLAEIADPQRFGRPEQLVAYCGTVVNLRKF
jgi:transposase